MTIRGRRVVITAVVVEILAVAALILIPAGLVIWGGVATAANAEADLQRYGRWVGPTTGFLFCLLGGWWVARRLDSDQERNGLALGLLAATLDVGLLTYAGAPFAWVFVLSTAGRIVAGYLGGGLARKRRTKHNLRRESFRVSSEA
jgi:hypothetical protein